MASALQLNKTWAGFYIHSSGDMIAAGYESYTGIMWRLDDPYYNRLAFTSSNYRLGAGLGGSIGAGLLMFFNVQYNLGWIEEQSLGHGWHLSLDLPVKKLTKFKDLVKNIQKIQQAYEILGKIQELKAFTEEIWKLHYSADSNPIIHVLAEGNQGLSAGLMRSFGGKIDILGVHGRGGYVPI